MKRFVLMIALAALAAAPLMAADAAKPAAMCCLKDAGAQRTVTNLDNGVKIEIASADPKIVALIQDETATCPKPGCSQSCQMQAKGVTRTVEKTSKGVVITATSSDSAQVKALQEHAATQWDKPCPHKAGKACSKGKGEAHGSETGGKCPYAKGGAAQS